MDIMIHLDKKCPKKSTHIPERIIGLIVDSFCSFGQCIAINILISPDRINNASIKFHLIFSESSRLHNYLK